MRGRGGGCISSRGHQARGHCTDLSTSKGMETVGGKGDVCGGVTEDSREDRGLGCCLQRGGGRSGGVSVGGCTRCPGATAPPPPRHSQ